MPNLDNLKKQAKLILRWHRERTIPSPHKSEAFASFPEYADSEILAASLSSAMPKKWSQDSKGSIIGKP